MKKQQNVGEYAEKKPRNKLVTLFIIVLAVVIFTVGGWFTFYNYNLRPVSSESQSTIVDIPNGASISDVADILKEKNLIRSAIVFKSYAGKHSRAGKQIQAAVYEFSPNMSVEEIFTKMVSGDVHKGSSAVIIPEGKNLKEIAQIFDDHHICSKSDFIKEASKLSYYKAQYPILDSIPDAKDRTLEGYLFADTYYINPETPASQVVQKMLDRFTQVFDAQMQTDIAALNKSVDEIVIMASIVELETKLDEDKPNAASVFYNRIKADMPLQSDITVDYALGSKHPVLTEAQTQTDSPYNTYINLGLPVGPICSPGIEALNAAIHPAKTDYYYFVADMSTGKLYFNATFEGHNADIEKYM